MTFWFCCKQREVRDQVSFGAAVTKCCGLGGLEVSEISLTVLAARSPRSAASMVGSGGDPLPSCRVQTANFLSPHRRGLSGVSFMRTPPS